LAQRIEASEYIVDVVAVAWLLLKLRILPLVYINTLFTL